MKKKLTMLFAVALVATTFSARAGLNVLWGVGYGIYPFGASDPAAVDAGTGLLANNGTGSTLIQLLFSPTGTIGIVDPNAVDYVSGDNYVLNSITAQNGVGGYDEWAFNNTLPQYVNATFTAGSYFLRVFHDATPTAGEYYYDSSLLVAQDVANDPGSAQFLYFEPDPANSGVALNLTIVPEPSVIAFLGLGGLALAARRRFVA